MPGFSSAKYWEGRYAHGGNSGAGSYGRLAIFKADFINQFVALNAIRHVVEFGCGDGHQLAMLSLPQYVGIDVSNTILEKCRKEFNDARYNFVDYDGLADVKMADLALSIDVIFHLVEDHIFEKYMRDLFCFALRYVVIYSSDYDSSWPDEHVRHRSVVNYVRQIFPEWDLAGTIQNPYPYNSAQPYTTSFCNFMVFNRRVSKEATLIPENVIAIKEDAPKG